ncbi:MAG: NUDIX hydrolase [Aquificae bacterium]|nr:NUDIX hydrolase [Aquificota bacterium]
MGELRTPLLATDVIVRLWDENRFRGIVLIERKNPPVGLALPGGFVEVGESVEEAAVREMREEIGLEVRLKGLLGVYSDPDRDPRFHVVSVVWIGDARGEPRAGSDAKEVKIYRLEEIPLERLVFDHGKILRDFLSLTPLPVQGS